MIDLTSDPKKQLIEKIKGIQDQNIIDEIYRLLGIDFDDTVYKTTNEQKNAIYEAQKQIKTNQTLSENEANEEIDKWLNK